MGKGSGTNQKNVIKPAAKYSAAAATVGGGGGYAGEDIQNCLFGLKIELNNIDTSIINIGDNATLVGSDGEGIDIFVNNEWFDTYLGRHKKLLLRCMSEGFVYAGKVTAIGAGSVTIEVKGLGAVQ